MDKNVVFILRGPWKRLLSAVPSPLIMASGGVNNTPPHPMRKITSGIIAPLPTFFLPENEDLGAYFSIALTLLCADGPDEPQTCRRSKHMWYTWPALGCAHFWQARWGRVYTSRMASARGSSILLAKHSMRRVSRTSPSL